MSSFEPIDKDRLSRKVDLFNKEPKVGDKIAYAEKDCCGGLYIRVGTITEITKSSLKLKLHNSGQDFYYEGHDGVHNTDYTYEISFNSRHHCPFIILNK